MTPTHKSIKKYYRTVKNEEIHAIRTAIFDAQHAESRKESNPNRSLQLKETDQEIPLELLGKIISRTYQIVVNEHYQPVYDFREIDQLTKPDGTKISRDHKIFDANINGMIPVLVTDQFSSFEDLLLKYIFRKSYYLYHKDGISYKFLYELAKKLTEKHQMVKIIAFEKEKKPGPLVLYRGGRPFAAAFLEGMVQGEKYCLILHLSYQELRLPVKSDENTISQSEVES